MYNKSSVIVDVYYLKRWWNGNNIEESFGLIELLKMKFTVSPPNTLMESQVIKNIILLRKHYLS